MSDSEDESSMRKKVRECLTYLCVKIEKEKYIIKHKNIKLGVSETHES